MAKWSGGRQYTITAEIPYRFPISNEERELANLQVEVSFTHTPGCPAVMYQRNGDPGWPAEADEIEFVNCKLIDGDGLSFTPSQLVAIVCDWLDDAGYEQACAMAGEYAEDDGDAAYEAKRDRELDR